LKLLDVLREDFVLMVSLPRNCPELARIAVDAGAQCLKVHINCHHFASDTTFRSWKEERSVLEEIKTACGKVPLGLVTGEATQPGIADLEEITEFGFDFWDLFCKFTPPEFLDLPNMGRMVAIDSGWEPWLVEGLAALHVDVIESSIVPRESYRSELNLEDLTRYRRLAKSSKMPILIPTQKAIKPGQVKYLKRAGAAGITIGAVVTGLEKASFKEATSAFRWAIDDLS
jgi:hypothetical protein